MDGRWPRCLLVLLTMPEPAGTGGFGQITVEFGVNNDGEAREVQIRMQNNSDEKLPKSERSHREW